MRKSEYLYRVALQYAKDKIDKEFDGDVEKYLLDLLTKDNPKSATEHVQQLRKDASGLKRKLRKKQKPYSPRSARTQRPRRIRRVEPIPGQVSLFSNSQ